jgi:hypothetical protein
MQVETYECTEITAAGVPEDNAEQVALIERLALKGQQALISGKGEEREVIPYRYMTAQESFVYLTLCPRATPVEEYSLSPIPVRVLQVISHARELDIGKLLVLHPEDPADPDPVLVSEGAKEYRKYRLLARWGEELASFEELGKRAVKVAAAKTKAEISKCIAAAQADLARLAAMDDIAAWGSLPPGIYYSGLR